jgi:hypothetical protein
MKLAFLFFLISLNVQAQTWDALAQSPEWLHLLHMKKGWFGKFQSSVQGGSFFISPHGEQDPEAELQATIQSMFQADPEMATKTQCHFLARRDFLLRHGDPKWKTQILPCQFSDQWLSTLHATKISIIFASGYLNSPASSFGHTFLKLQNPDNEGGKELLDYGINFSARTQETNGALYALYGLFGYFPGAFSMLPYHQLIKDYTHLEGRDLWEYELDFTPEEVQRILFHLLELDRAYFDYYFVDDNCSYELLKALEVGRPGLRLAGEDEFFVIPIDTVKVIQPLVKNIKFRPSLDTEWVQRREKLQPPQLQGLLSWYRNPSVERIKILDSETSSATQYLASLKELEDREKWKNLNYGISRELALRGARFENFKIERPKNSPETGPDSSAVQLGFLEDQQRSYLLSGFHFAFHDQLSRNVSVPPCSHLEVLGFQWQSAQVQQNWLRRYRLLEVLSTKAVDGFEKPLSWTLSLGADNESGFPQRLRHKALLGFGYSFDLLPEQIRWSHLVMAGTQQDFDHNFQFTPGYDSRLWVLWSPEVRSFLQYEIYRFPGFQSQNFSAYQVFDLNRQLELRLGWNSLEESRNLQVEKSIFLVQNFLL